MVLFVAKAFVLRY